MTEYGAFTLNRGKCSKVLADPNYTQLKKQKYFIIALSDIIDRMIDKNDDWHLSKGFLMKNISRKAPYPNSVCMFFVQKKGQ